MNARAAAVALVIAMSSSALAQSVPAYDIDAYCRRLSKDSYSTELGCRTVERSARTWLESNDIPGDIWRNCIGLGRRTNNDSYSMLKGCVMVETSAKDRLRK